VTSLTARDVIPAPAVHGNVTGAGRKRTLAYTAKLAAGDSVRFVEVGRSSSQRIGGTTATVRRSGLGRIRFDTGSGPAGERRIFAEIERHGAPFDLLPVDSYNAPKPPPVPKPRQARAKLSHGRLVVSWRGRESIKAYEVIVKLSDGRVLRSKTTKQHTKFSNVGAQTGVRATVYADGRDGRQSKPAHVRIEARGPAPVTISP
jgi:hypothetical protein